MKNDIEVSFIKYCEMLEKFGLKAKVKMYKEQRNKLREDYSTDYKYCNDLNRLVEEMIVDVTMFTSPQKKTYKKIVPVKENDAIKPNHYRTKNFECIKVVNELVEGMTGSEAVAFFNSFKYLWRYKKKNGIEDLKKCKYYLDELIKINGDVNDLL